MQGSSICPDTALKTNVLFSAHKYFKRKENAAEGFGTGKAAEKENIPGMNSSEAARNMRNGAFPPRNGT